MIAVPSERTRALSLMAPFLAQRTAALGFGTAVLHVRTAFPSLMTEAPTRTQPRLGRGPLILSFPHLH